MTSPPVAYKNILITQGATDRQGWDAVTGELRWTFNLKAQPGDPKSATWLNES